MTEAKSLTVSGENGIRFGGDLVSQPRILTMKTPLLFQIFQICLTGGFLMSMLVAVFGAVGCPRIRFSSFRRIFPRAPRLRGSSATNLVPPGTFLALASVYITLAGALGLGGLHLRLTPWQCIAFAIVGAFALAVLLGAVFRKYFIAGNEPYELSSPEMFGMVGHVSVRIPADGVGAVALNVQGKRVTPPARSRYGMDITSHSAVMIVGREGPVFLVEEI